MAVWDESGQHGGSSRLLRPLGSGEREALGNSGYRQVGSRPQALTRMVFLHACRVRTRLSVMAVAVGC